MPLARSTWLHRRRRAVLVSARERGGDSARNALDVVGAEYFRRQAARRRRSGAEAKFADGRNSPSPRRGAAIDLEAWRIRSGETSDNGMLDDLAERLTQLLHEQGVAAGVDVWEDNGDRRPLGRHRRRRARVRASSSAASRAAERMAPRPRAASSAACATGVFARRFEAAGVDRRDGRFRRQADLHVHHDDGARPSPSMAARTASTRPPCSSGCNDQLRENGINAARLVRRCRRCADLARRRVCTTCSTSRRTLNDDEFDADLQAPGAWATGGLPNATCGRAVRRCDPHLQRQRRLAAADAHGASRHRHRRRHRDRQQDHQRLCHALERASTIPIRRRANGVRRSRRASMRR